MKTGMAKETSYKNGGDERIIITIPPQVKKNLPDDFNLRDIGTIDLREAETIASEDILFLNEGDLIEGLEDFELIPLAASPVGERPGAPEKRPAEVVPSAVPDTAVPEKARGAADAGTAPATADDGRRWIPLEKLDRFDEEGREWTPLEEVLEGIERARTAGPSAAAGIPPADEKAAEEPPAVAQGLMDDRDLLFKRAVEEFGTPGQVPPLGEGYDTDRDEYLIVDLGERVAPLAAEPVRKTGVPEKTAAAEREIPHVEEPPGMPAGERPPDKGAAGGEIAAETVAVAPADLTGEFAFIPLEDGALLPAKTESVDHGPAPIRAPAERPAPHEAPAAFAAAGPARKPGPEPMKPLFIDRGERPKARPVAPSDARIYFIDDTAESELPVTDIFDEIKLEKMISATAQVDEGASYMLHEADIHEDRERIVQVANEIRPVHADEHFVDLAYRYGDEELDYVHTAIVEDDYGDYMKGIDELFGSGGRAIPEAVELLGMTADELDTVEDLLFRDEMKDFNRYDRYGLYQFDRATRDVQASGRSFRYLLPTEDSLIDVERKSIESDVSSDSALIFEEDVETIREHFRSMTGRADTEPFVTQETAAVVAPPPEEVMAPEFREGPDLRLDLTLDDEVRDITDRVVILDDEEDVERFVREFPERKQVDIRILLKYLDGLFERLPEEIIRKFASSEYYDLYLKVLNEMGV